MLFSLFKRLYPSVFRYEEMFYAQRDARLQLEKENKGLKSALAEQKQKISLLKSLSKDNSLTTVKMIEDKGGKELFLTITETFGGLYNRCIDVCVYNAAIEWKCRIGYLTTTKYDDHIFIEDFKVMDEDLGIGSMMINELVRFVDKRNAIAKTIKVATMFDQPFFYESIHGKLSYVDWNHIEKLRHFYSKLGFEVVTSDSDQKGSIKKEIDIQSL